MTVNSCLKYTGWWVCSIDLMANDQSDANVLVNPKDDWLAQEVFVTAEVQKLLGVQKVDSVLNMAGKHKQPVILHLYSTTKYYKMF